MICRMEKTIRITPSMCDSTKKLAVHNIFTLFMDLASEHGHDIGLGADRLAEKGLFWLTVKTKIHIEKLPQMLDTITAVTWPEKAGKIRCNRYYALYDKGELLVEGKTEWAIVDIKTGKLCKTADEFWGGIEFCEDTVCNEPFEKISDDFSNSVKLYDYTVKSTDIDLGQHMNNAAYPRAIFGAFSCKESIDLNVRDMEIVFRNPSFEGTVLSIYSRKYDSITEVGMLFPDGKAAVVARIK